MPLDPVSLAIQNAAIVLEIFVAILVWMLFALIRRRAMHRAYFATWGSGWFWMMIAIVAVGARYVILPAAARNLTSDSDASVRILYALYQTAKLLYWSRVLLGAIEYVRPDFTPSRAWVAVPLGYTVVSVVASTSLNQYVVWQAPVAIAC